MEYVTSFKNIGISNDERFEILERFNVLENYGVRDCKIQGEQNKKNICIKLSFYYCNKFFKFEKQGQNLDKVIDDILDIAYKQLDKIDNKNSTINNKYKIKMEQLSDKFDFSDISFLEKSINYKKEETLTSNYQNNEIKNIESMRTNYDEHKIIPYCSYENACIQLELLGYDFFFFKDSNTKKIMVVYKDFDNYVSEIC